MEKDITSRTEDLIYGLVSIFWITVGVVLLLGAAIGASIVLVLSI